MAFPDNIPSNSISKNYGENKRQEKKDYKVLGADMKAREKKKGPLMKYILPEDVPDVSAYLKSQKDYLIRYILIPKIQQVLADSFLTIIGLGGQVKTDNRGGGLLPKLSYNSNGNQYNYQKIPQNTQQKKTVMYQDIYLPSEAACKEFKELVQGLFYDQDGFISVLQYMDIAGKGTFPEQNNYGWNSVSQIEQFKYRYTVDGWLVTMPYPQPLD